MAMNAPSVDPGTSARTSSGPSPATADGASGSGMSGFAVLVGLGFLFILSFFGLALVAVWKRSESDASRSASFAVPVMTTQSASMPAAAPSAPTAWRKAIVTVPRPDMQNGVMRNAPGFNTPHAAYIPRGTTVDVGPARYKDGQTWYQVRAELGGKEYEGFMHSDILVWVP